MNKPKKSTIEVRGTAVSILTGKGGDYISLTDMLKAKDGEFAIIRSQAGLNNYKTLSKLNYRIHTDAIKAHLIPPEITPAQAAITYATEADLLNVALFGQTAKQWRDANPKLEGNKREYASPLPQAAGKVAELEAKVKHHLERMGFQS